MLSGVVEFTQVDLLVESGDVGVDLSLFLLDDFAGTNRETRWKIYSINLEYISSRVRSKKN